MPRVIGVDPGTVSVDLFGLDGGRVFLDRSLPTAEALASPSVILDLVDEANRQAPLDLVAGPSGYGLPLIAAPDLTETDVRLACLSSAGETGGIGGLASLMRALGRSRLPIVFMPGVIHLQSVPAHRKVNRVDMGTADKVCAVALALHREAARRACGVTEVSFILLELGGAFTAAIAVDRGAIVDGVGGSSGPIGARAAGALDGEVAYLAGSIPKRTLFSGGAAAVAGTPDWLPLSHLADAPPRIRQARDAYLENAVKAVAALTVSAPGARQVLLSGRIAHAAGVREELTTRLAAQNPDVSVDLLDGLGVASEAAQGAALIADGLAGGSCAELVDALRLRTAAGTVLDHLYVIDQASARARLGIS